jgi:hypothetical protein
VLLFCAIPLAAPNNRQAKKKVVVGLSIMFIL